MAIIKQGFMLNNYDGKVVSAHFACGKNPENCEKMLKKLVFYDREQLLDAHTEEVLHSKPLDIKSIKRVDVLEKSEAFDQVVPLDKDCLGVFIKDKETGKRVDKALYITFSGDAYLTDDITGAQNGFVPDYVYYQNAHDDLFLFGSLDKKYFDGNHEKLLENIIEIMKERIAEMIFSSIFKIENISYEEGMKLIEKGFAERKTNPELYDKVRNADFLASEFGSTVISDFYSKRKKNIKGANSSQPGDE